MKDLVITKGEWQKDKDTVFSTSKLIFIEGNVICSAPEGLEKSMKKWSHNAKLISDAGTTANKCGSLPSELLRQRDDMLEFMRNIANHEYTPDSYRSEAHELIQKITKQ